MRRVARAVTAAQLLLDVLGALTVSDDGRHDRAIRSLVAGAAIGLKAGAGAADDLRNRTLAVAVPSKTAMKCIGYRRVSSQEQSRSGLGLGAQEEAITSACSRFGWDLVEVITDRAESGKSLDRPGFQQVLHRIANGDADALVVSRLDRATRSVADFARLLEWLEQAGAAFVALDLAIDTSTPAGRLVANVFASVAEWERAVIGERTKQGMAVRKAAGESISRPSIQGTALAKRIRSMRGAGKTYQAIADKLNEEGVPTVRGGAEWRVSSVQVAAGYERPPTKPRRPDFPPIKRRRAQQRASR